MSGDLARKTVIVTGAASGQGKAGARLFARAGSNLALCDSDDRGLRETAELIAAESGVEVLAIRCDLALVAEIELFVKSVIDRFEVIDVIYNSADLMLHRSIEATSESDWNRIVDFNVKATFFIVKYALPALLKSDGGSIVNVASVCGLLSPREGDAVYSASNGAVMALTRAQARDLAPQGIRVNCIVAGGIDPALHCGERAHPGENLITGDGPVPRSLIPRLGRVDEVASLALFLAGGGASYITGATIPVDGGWIAC